MTELILIRHGETDWNAEHRIQGHLDIPLNSVGLSQAKAIGKRFRDVDIDLLVSSDLRRAIQTIAPISEWRNLPVLRETRLRERHLGVLQGKTPEEAQRFVPDVFEVFRCRAENAVLAEGESLSAFAERVINVLTTMTEEYLGKRIVAVTHGGVLDIAYRHATGMLLAAPRRFPIRNASVNTFRADGPKFELVSWSDVDHLPDKQAMDEN
ncbi:MAG: histidine phosphatase family protein [Betaproteobacteria bacterium]|jgi:probable phosphoglycerate mutase|nr:MAG: histidine phosphatase family protein [Betaproteobacteria bacterium]